MNRDKLNALFNEYDLGSIVDATALPKTTSRNDAYIILSSTGHEYVLRTLVRQSVAGAEDERRIQEALRDAGITAPLYLYTKNDRIVATTDSVSAVVSEKIEGSRQAVDTLELAHDMGITLARMHDAIREVKIRPNEQQWFAKTNLVKQLELYDGPKKGYIETATRGLMCLFHMGLPRAVIHGDFHTKNIFSANDKVTDVFDFESAEHTIRIFDIARTYLTYRKVTNLDHKAIFISITEGYNTAASKPLTRQEYENFQNVCIFVALVSLVSIYNHGNAPSSAKYLEITQDLQDNHSHSPFLN
jgi:Ser/Thr protein kinase RdoA (MazF antagonist)